MSTQEHMTLRQALETADLVAPLPAVAAAALQRLRLALASDRGRTVSELMSDLDSEASDAASA